ncbi:MAG: hypothetical protein HUJ79_03435 [Firmicutes bacterium]|nr:hypothetical protein [Bacillota bacterium]
MKRILPLFISIILVSVTLLSGCGEKSRENQLQEAMSVSEDKLQEIFTDDIETCEYSQVSTYLNAWADDTAAVSVIYNGKTCTVLSNPATRGCEEEPSTALLCNVNTNNIQGSIKMISTATSCLLGPEEHGDIILIFTETKDARYIGFKELPKKYLNCDNLINLQSSGSDTILIGGPNYATAKFHKDGELAQTRYTNAYKISMTIPKYTDPYNYAKEHNFPSPVDTIGSLFASAMSAGRLFDIASFNSEAVKGYNPYTASIVVVVDDNSVESITSRFDKTNENLQEKFEKLEEDFEFTMEEVPMPEAVLSEDVSNNFLSLMYTLNTGACMQDENSGVINAASFIQSVNTNEGNLDLSLDIRTRGESFMDNICTEYETTAGLCSTEFKCKKQGKLWSSDSKSELRKFFTDAVPLQPDKESDLSMRAYENDYITDINPDLNMIIYTFEKGNRKTVLSNVLEFLDPAIEK